MLDPVCGKGTTLQEALLAGYNGEGIDLNGKAVSEGVGYLKKYLELGFYKHTLHKERVSGPNKSFTAETASFTIGLDKTSFKEDPYQVKFAVGDSRFCPMILGKNRFDLLVGDLALRGAAPERRRRRAGRGLPEPQGTADPLPALLARGAEKRRGAGPELEHLPAEPAGDAGAFGEGGFAPFTEPPYDSFCHRVDAAISRDAVLARRD